MKTPAITAFGEILYDLYPDKKRLGGAPFNFIYHVWKLSGNGNLISSVGNDDNGREIISFLHSIGFNTEYIYIDEEHVTGTVNVKIDEHGIPRFTISPECSYDFLKLTEKSKKLLETETDLLYFGTLAQRSSVTRSSLEEIYKIDNLKFFCDLNLRHDFFSKPLVEQVLKVSNVIKLNEEELFKVINMFDYRGDEKEVIERLSHKYNIDLVSITKGAEGALLYDGKDFNYYKNSPRKVIDTVGAGDAFSAILCLGYLQGIDTSEINKIANEFAADICEIEGAIPAEDTLYDKYKNKIIKK
ncbi:carbohydrate kinase family protein [Melioribacter sp. OK-6-Me]|uniref:carbohydrate kinase family protein n=1 Tax=unclassified Melioribacter TaxID=2627329 RepID=UPI003ED95485